MRYALKQFVALVFSLVTIPAVQAATVYKNFSQPVSFSYFVPCANGGQGEMVDFSGFMLTTLAEAKFAMGYLPNERIVHSVSL